MKETMRLSQCMIVKNEEENIERALSWGKGLVYEQIVVDTGSTDRTVELAEQMGAKVYHFQWGNDFSAAKNFALEHATGNWIAFLDADEYFREGDIPRLKHILKKIAESPQFQTVDLIRCTMLHLDDDGKPFSTMQQDRIFRNLPELRYEKKVHEALYHTKGRKLARVDLGSELPILHTGYASKAITEKQKSERNIEILQSILKDHPEEGNNWSYLGDAYLLDGKNAEAKAAFRNALECPSGVVHPELVLHSISELMRFSIDDADFTMEEWEKLYKRYQETGDEHPDIEYWSGLYLYCKGKWQDAETHLLMAFAILDRTTVKFTVYLTGILDKAYGLLAEVYLKLNRKPDAVKCLTLSLKANPYRQESLSQLLELFQKGGESATGVLDFLRRLYDFSQMKSKLFVLRETQKLGYFELEEAVRTCFTEEEKQWLEAGKEEYQPGAKELQQRYPQITVRNQTDVRFLRLVDCLDTMNAQQMLDNIKAVLLDWKKQAPEVVRKLEDFYSAHPYWGDFKPAQGVYAAFGNRISLWKDQQEDFLWFYETLADYRSKRVFLAILENWFFLTTEGLERVKEYSYSYFDPDLLQLDTTMDVVDLMAGKGDYLRLFTEQLGEPKGTVFCYEQRAGMLALLREYAANFNSMKIQIRENLNPDMNELSNVGIIRINAEAAAFKILNDFKPLIEQNTPQLAVAPYFTYEDLIRIPKWLHELCADYKLYLRYYGDDLIATDYMLYAVKQ